MSHLRSAVHFSALHFNAAHFGNLDIEVVDVTPATGGGGSKGRNLTWQQAQRAQRARERIQLKVARTLGNRPELAAQVLEDDEALIATVLAVVMEDAD